MMSVWNPRRGSDLLTCLVFLLLTLSGTMAGWAAEGPSSVPPLNGQSLDFEPGVRPTAQQKNWLSEDRSWVAELVTIQGRSPAVGMLEAGPDSLAQVRRWVLAQTGGDTLQVARSLMSRLRDRWLERGYLAARVSPESGLSTEQLRVDPGPRFTVGDLTVEGSDFPDRAHLLRIWLPDQGSIFDPVKLARGIDQILAGAGENGFPFARWVTSEVSLEMEPARVNIRATLLPGQRSVIGPVTSDLAPGRPAEFLARASGLGRGHLFRQSDIQRSVQRLLAKDLYASVGTPRVYATTSVDTVGIHFPVVPRLKVNRLLVVLGLSRKQDDGPSRLSGEVDFRLPNMSGSGRNLGINWRDDGNQKSHFGFDYLEPMAFGTPLDMGLALDSEMATDSYTRFRLDNRWQLPVVALWGVELGLGWDRSTYPLGTLERTSRLRARGAFLHRRGDTSRSGWSGSFAIETARRSSALRPLGQEDVPVQVSRLGEALTQRIYEVDTAGEIWLGDVFSFAGRASFRQISGSEEAIPLGEQFYFGGAVSLRGYREDEFHGAKAAWGGLEARIGPPGGSRLYTFFDLGYFGFSSLESDLVGNETRVWKEDWPRGFGLGILARTPGGDISLAVGFPGTVDFDLAKLHVTLLESF